MTAAKSWSQIVAVFRKDVCAELRNRSALNAILLFAVTTLFVVSFAIGPAKILPVLKAALLWVVLFFAAFAGLAHVFLHEEETGTVTALRLSAIPECVFGGKLLFNMALLACISVIVVPSFMVVMDLHILRPFPFLAVLTGGCLSLAAAATAVAAIISKAHGKGALYGALGFPILLPLLIMSVHATQLTMSDVPLGEIMREVIGLFSFGLMLIAMSGLVFRFIWED